MNQTRCGALSRALCSLPSKHLLWLLLFTCQVISAAAQPVIYKAMGRQNKSWNTVGSRACNTSHLNHSELTSSVPILFLRTEEHWFKTLEITTETLTDLAVEASEGEIKSLDHFMWSIMDTVDDYDAHVWGGATIGIYYPSEKRSYILTAFNPESSYAARLKDIRTKKFLWLALEHFRIHSARATERIISFAPL